MWQGRIYSGVDMHLMLWQQCHRVEYNPGGVFVAGANRLACCRVDILWDGT